MSSTSRSVPAILPARAARAACSAGHGALPRVCRALVERRHRRGRGVVPRSPFRARRVT
ncbi:hypothetical protein HMPREF1138_0105 [Actinomyces sp. ICM58]|nr:hypothetical protein HMPREF1138_0105 [Actinomyces sp. ICM58]